ncbi:uncharacterized protein N7469_004425 [Penicillium citrinum]|uniref:Calcofluor white hypersensitive protein n=2 Tax=Penicillium TaxID=5073 RepID=A0A9W9P755_PENCI|nr:uncharacterized protein N7469_004425 [Penicillium citrinum]KAJ5235257.1 hypothetical protein N7469_004425 [Penicillium citrinum]KAJ5590884.1 hypothetical protein N7450_004856 [Penicillium hetheringtonii]
MSKNRTGVYLGLAAFGAGGYYLYRAGGDVKGAKQEMKIDADKAREKLPHGDDAQQKGAELGKEAGYQVDEAINNARSKFKLDERIPEMAQDGKDKLDGFRKDARDKIDQVDRTVEEKAAEAKGNVSSWFGGKK